MSLESHDRNSKGISLYIWIGGAMIAIALVVVFAILPALKHSSDSMVRVRYGITPYQDSALPTVADRLGWYQSSGIEFELVPLAWGDVVNALSSGAIDVAIYNFNSFQAPYENAIKGSREPVFYCPTYVFKGQAIMVHGDAGFNVFRDVEGESPAGRTLRVAEIARQLSGKRVAVTEGTELEQIVLEALSIAGLQRSTDVQVIHASPENGLAAFLARDIDAFAAGLTERTEARRHGAVELLVTSDVTLPVIDGIITTSQFAAGNGHIMDTLVQLWFRTISFMEQDLPANSSHIRDYLAAAASTRYSVEEYEVAWSFNVFPTSADEANGLFNSVESPYYWKKSWDENNEYLIEEGKLNDAVPDSAYWGNDVLARLSK